ncbi:hypothetical protein PG994_001715 [Apiospora phragmitis]|uniref:Uncharacterized protein n=1 Tax=Apiospora phragmitis TaxID=2905665 RepID=A0ABR1WUB8_9PEZI
MKGALAALITLTITLGDASTDARHARSQLKTMRNTLAVLDQLSHDQSGHGFNRLNPDVMVQSVDAEGQVVDEVHLTNDEAATIRASLHTLTFGSSKETSNTLDVLERETSDCPYTICGGGHGCPSGCPGVVC